MTKDLIIIDGAEAKRYIMKKSYRPMTVVRQRLFRTDDRFMMRCATRPDTMIIYGIDDTQPRGVKPEYINPDETMAYIDIGRPNKKSNVNILDSIGNIDGMKFIYIAVAIVVILSVAGLI